MRILITGICGFVGSTLAETLVDSVTPGQLTLTGIDNFCRSGSWLNRERLAARGVRVVHGDIRSSADLEGLGPFDWVVDAAANPSVLAGVDGKSSSRQLVDNNLGGTINLLEACKRWNAGFILLSTSRVYSIPPLANLEVEIHDRAYRPILEGWSVEAGISKAGISERFSTKPPVSLYGVTKLASEALALEYGATFGFPVWVNRCGVMAGARQFGKPDQGIFSFWIHSWREQLPLKYIGFDGRGHQVRDCLHPRDLASLVLKQFSHGNTELPDTSSSIINVSGGIASAMSLRELSDWCADRFPNSETRSSLQSPEEPQTLPVVLRPFDLPWVVLDSGLAEREWDWSPSTKVEEILEEISSFALENPSWIALSA